MTLDRDPPRLFDQTDVDDMLRRALHTAAHDGPSSARLEAMLNALPLANQAAPAALAGATKTAGKLLWFKLGGALMLGALPFVLWSRPAPAPVRPLVQEGPVVVAQAERTETVTPPKERARAIDLRVQTFPSSEPYVAHVEPLLGSARPTHADAAHTPRTASEPRGQRLRVDVTTAAQSRTGPKLLHGEAHAERSRATNAATKTTKLATAGVATEPPVAQQPSADDAVSELSLIEQAQLSLLRAPAQTLQWVERHRAQFPAGVLAEEREVLAIDALMALRRSGEAAIAARRFLQRYPHSLHRQRIQALAP